MTMAVCFKCGSIKHGAFTRCSACQTDPQTEADVTLSLAMTDHFHDEQTLRQMGREVQAGNPPRLSAEMLKSLSDNPLLKRMPRRVRRMNGSPESVVTGDTESSLDATSELRETAAGTPGELGTVMSLPDTRLTVGPAHVRRIDAKGNCLFSVPLASIEGVEFSRPLCSVAVTFAAGGLGLLGIAAFVSTSNVLSWVLGGVGILLLLQVAVAGIRTERLVFRTKAGNLTCDCLEPTAVVRAFVVGVRSYISHHLRDR